MQNKVFMLITLTVISTFAMQSAVYADEFDEPIKLEYQRLYGKEFGHNFQAGVSFGMRVDEQEFFDFSPSAGLTLFYNLTPVFAIRAETGYSRNRTQDFSRIKSIYYTAALIRIKDMRGLFSPFAELGLISEWYVFSSDIKYTLGILGFKSAIGFELKLSQALLLDLSISQTFNNRGEFSYTLNNSPCQIETVCKGEPPNNFLNDHFLNPAYIEMLLRFDI